MLALWVLGMIYIGHFEGFFNDVSWVNLLGFL